MASIGQAVSSATRLVARAKVKPSAIQTQHPAFFKPAAAVIPASSEPAPVAAPATDYIWDVKWPGHPVSGDPNVPPPMVDTAEIAKAFKTWSIFSLGGMDFWAMTVFSATGAVFSKLPIK